jgi:ribonucleoside-diphosphate reductase alpha chain
MTWKSQQNPQFRSQFSQSIFHQKYAHEGCETWSDLAAVLAHEVCADFMPLDEVCQLANYIEQLKFIPGGRYLYYAGRPNPFYNNCYLLRSEEDTREDWADLSWKAESCLLTGGGIGNDYSIYREEGARISRTGGTASGPIPKMEMVNEIGRRVMQGGSRRSAIYASLNWRHPDAGTLLTAKDWDRIRVPGTDLSLADLKARDFNWPCPLDMTNVSLNYDDAWLNTPERHRHPIFLANVRQALRTAEPGFSFNFGDKQNETLRNACTEVTSSDDSDVCNLGSLNFGRIESLGELRDIVALATKFLLCGTLKAKLPYDKVAIVREHNRRLGLGIMGMHEWLIKRNERYAVTPELHNWLAVYRDVSDYTSRTFADRLGVSRPVANRAIAPTGTIGILAGTTTGIEPLFAVAYKRRYLKGGSDWHYQYVVDGTAQEMIDLYGTDPERIESAIDLAQDYERRILFQARVQDYVDMAISSTINLPRWGSEHNNEDTVERFAATLARYAPRLRGFTCYPDGARGGQPLTATSYAEAKAKLGTEFREAVETHDICDISGKGGSCGV